MTMDNVIELFPRPTGPFFRAGQIVRHKQHDFRGVIVDVHPVFDGCDDWYEEAATTRPPKNKPWYHVLVDDSVHTAYAAESELLIDEQPHRITHPLIEFYFESFDGESYR